MAYLDWSKVSWNLLIFVIIQSLFFYAVSSEFVLNIVEDKAYRLGRIVANQIPADYRGMAEKEVKDRENELEVEVELSRDERNIKNRNLLLARMAPWFGGGLLILLITTWLSLSQEDINFLPELSIYGIILLSYLTEVILFFLMVKRYEYVGTFEILKIINDKLPSRKGEMGILGRKL